MTTANVLTSLGAADLDTKQLVTDLVNAVKEPRQKQIDENKKKAEVAVSSLGLLKSALSNLQTTTTELGSVGKLNKLSISNSNTGVVLVEAGNTAVALPGNHSLTVTQLAQAKRLASAGFSSSTSVVSPAGFTLTLDKAITVQPGTTVAGLVSAINASGSAVSARLVNTGTGATPYQIVLEGASGAANSFTASMTAVSGTPSLFQAGATELSVTDLIGITKGTVIAGAGIPDGTIVTAVDTIKKTITLSNATIAAASGGYLFGPVDDLSHPLSLTPFNAGVTQIPMTDLSGIWIGATISGSGIPAGTTVTAIDAASKRITLSQATTGTYAGSYSFSGLFPTTLQNAQDASFTVNGVAMTRPSNVVTDALDGLTLRLNSASATPVQLGVSFNSADIAGLAQRFVESYNVLMEFINTATGPAIKDNDLSATLQNDSSIRGLKTSLRSMLTSKSSSSSGNATHWSVLGVSLDRAGVLQFDEAKFKSNFEKNPTDVVKALSNNASQPFIYSNSPSGLAGDMARTVFGMVRSTGTLADVQQSYENKLSRIEKEQTKLDKQIESLSTRYERQFSALNAVLAEFKATSKRLDSTFNSNKGN